MKSLATKKKEDIMHYFLYLAILVAVVGFARYPFLYSAGIQLRHFGNTSYQGIVLLTLFMVDICVFVAFVRQMEWKSLGGYAYYYHPINFQVVMLTAVVIPVGLFLWGSEKIRSISKRKVMAP